MKSRPVAIVMTPETENEAVGVVIRRTIGSGKFIYLDPFLLLDHLTLDPNAQDTSGAKSTEGIGFPRHPHRGIETLTYVFAGQMHHKDSIGNDDHIEAHGSQFMTAGTGIFHEEYAGIDPSTHAHESLQIWFNLPAAQKRIPAYYASKPAAQIPEVRVGEATVRVVAGEFQGVIGAFTQIAVQPRYFDVHLPAGASVTLPAPFGENTAVYVYRGTAHLGPDKTPVSTGHLAVFASGEEVVLEAGNEQTRLIFISAKPLGEPVLQYRSLVMNTVDEMKEALDDLQNGTFV